jgi:hypothetical protein
LSDTTDTVVGSLDMMNDKDRGLLRRKLDDAVEKSHRPRWPGIDEPMKGRYVQALNIALALSLRKEDHRGINGCVKTLAMLVGQNQADDHIEEKNARIDSGKPTDTNLVQVRFVNRMGGDDAPS